MRNEDEFVRAIFTETFAFSESNARGIQKSGARERPATNPFQVKRSRPSEIQRESKRESPLDEKSM